MPHCETARYALAAMDLVRLARGLGYAHLARRLARHPGGMAERQLARQLARAAAAAGHPDHATGPCRRTAVLGGRPVLLLTTRHGPRHMIRAAHWQASGDTDGLRRAAVPVPAEDAEALFDSVIG